MKCEPIEKRFWDKVRKTDNCWIWIGSSQKKGYGIILSGGKNGGKRMTATRFIYEQTYGYFDKFLYVCHKCDNPACVRPDHLFLGTQKDNMKDCSKKNRTGKRKTKPFKFISPTGEIIEGNNLTKFCKDNKLNQGAMWGILAGNIKSHHGYRRFMGRH